MVNVEERVWLFNVVRDIPFYVAVGEEQDYSCATKALILDKLLTSIGLKCRHIICEFRWRRLGLPEDILKHLDNDSETHEYLEVWIPEKNEWVKVDPSWDSRIKHPSFPIATWDGLTSTVIAVPVEKVYSPEESIKLIEEETEEVRKKYLKERGAFFAAFNKWLEEQRK